MICCAAMRTVCWSSQVSHEDAVLAAAEEIDAIEQQIRAAINEGKTLAEARRQLGYHQLQTRRK